MCVHLLEGQRLIVLVYFHKSVVSVGGHRLGCRLGCAIAEFHIVRDYFGDVAFRAVLRVIGARLQAAFHGNLAAFGKVLSGEFGGITPTHDIKEIRFALSLCVCESALYCDAQVALGYA